MAIHSKNTLVYIDQFDVSGDSVSMDAKYQRGMPEATVFTSTGRVHLAAPSTDEYLAEVLFEDAATGEDAVMGPSRVGSVVNVCSWAPNTDALSKIIYAGNIFSKNYPILAKVGDVLRARFEVNYNGQADRCKSLGAKGTVTATTAGTSIDDAASSTAAGNWYYHVFAWSATGGNARWQLILEDSADNITFATALSQSYNITAVGAAQNALAGTLRRYVRVRAVLDATTGSITYQASYKRS